MALYNGYHLRRGDSDRTKTYGGQVQGNDAGGHVAQLRSDLAALGFAIALRHDDGADGRDFDGNVEDAVREFQIAVKSDHLAIDDGSAEPFLLDRLSSVAVTAVPVTTPVTGVVNAATNARIASWQKHKWRNPHLVVPYRVPRKRKLPWPRVHEEMAHTTDYRDSGPRMFVHSFAPTHGETANGRVRSDEYVVGFYTHYTVKKQKYANGQIKRPRRVWSGATLKATQKGTDRHGAVTARALTGNPIESCGPAQRSTFKVVYAMSLLESVGYSDIHNCYDVAVLSFGLFHWTIVGRMPSTPDIVDGGELTAFFAYVGKKDPPLFDDLMGRWGLFPAKEWGDTGKALFDSKARVYRAMPQRDAEDANGTVKRVSLPGAEPTSAPSAAVERVRTWAWVARLTLAMRLEVRLMPLMWQFARLRLRDIGTVPLAKSGAWKSRTIAECFSSELAMSVLLRAHVNGPGYVLDTTGGTARAVLPRILSEVGADPAVDPALWGDVHAAIADLTLKVFGRASYKFTNPKLSFSVPDTVYAHLEQLASWRGRSSGDDAQTIPGEEQLSKKGGSFMLDTSELTPEPY